MQRSSLLRQGRVHRSAGVVVGGMLAGAGCLWIWHESPRLTAIYNAEYTSAFLGAFPWILGFADLAPGGVDAGQSVARLLLGLGLMALGYLVAIACAQEVVTWLAVIFAVVFRCTLALLPGLFSTDVFSYVMYGRIAAVHGENPYVSPPSAFPDDPFLTWVFPFWRGQPSVYGPLWTDLSQTLSAITGSWSAFGQVLAYRGMVIGFDAVALVALWALLGRLQPQDRPRLWLLYAWNPLVVFDLVGASHNDAVMLALLLVGVLCVYGARSSGVVVGLGVVALSAMVKFVTAVAVPVLAVAWAASARDRRDRALRLGLGLGVPAVVAGALWWPWLAAGTDALAPMREAASGRLVLNSAVLVLVQGPLAPELATFVARAAFVVWCAWELLRVWRSPRGAIGASARLFLGLPLLVLTWVWSWYFSWSLALAVLLGVRSGLTRLTVAYTLVGLPVVTAHQYLNEQLPGFWIVAMAVAPLIVLVPIRSGRVARTFIKTGGRQPMTLRTLPPAWGITIVRLVAGIIIFWAAVEKFNAGGFANWTKAMANFGFPVPEFWGVFIPMLELVGGAMLILGLGARWAAVFFVIEYLGTSMWLKTTRPAPFGGWDSMRIDLMLLAAAVTILLVGPGAFALESWILHRGRGRAGVPMAGRAVPG
ncbi:MAG: DoxX family membrane protein [Chloroflexi bacterium]|nr:DoxX family membrane protein [Chloroflexota bacterium]